MICQWRHEAILRKAIESLGGKVELGTTFIGFTQDENHVTVELRKEVEGLEELETAKFKYVVGADGGKSMEYSHFLMYISA